MDLGKTLKDLRTSKNISIVNLAKEVGVSTSHISQIERGVSSPSIITLKKIANALQVPITQFFVDENENQGSIIKRDQRKKLKMPHSNLTYELLSPSMINEFQLLLTRIEVGGVMGDEPSRHLGAELCLIAKGTVEFVVNDERHVLSEGDTIYYPENTPHNVVNIGDDEAMILSVISPATF